MGFAHVNNQDGPASFSFLRTRPACSRLRREQRRQVVSEQIANVFDLDVRRRIGSQCLRVMGIVPLPREDSRQAASPRPS